MTQASIARPVSFRRKIPRGQLYLNPASAYRQLGRYALRGLERGSVVEAFERKFAELTHAPHAYALPHARTALHFLLMALEIPPGTQVVTTPVTIPDVVNVLLLHGLEVVFADLAPRTSNVDYEDLERKITDRTSLILVTHLCGFPSDMKKVMAIAERRGVQVLEDASQVIGASQAGQAPGLTSRAGFYSLSTLKALDTFCGGIVITRDEALDRRLRELTRDLPSMRWREFVPYVFRASIFYASAQRAVFTYGTYYVTRLLERLAPEYVSKIQKGNLPLTAFQPAKRREHLPDRFLVQYSDCQAAIGLEGLTRLAAETERRVRLAERLRERLVAGGVPGLPVVLDDAHNVYWRFPLWADDPDDLRAFLMDRYIDTATSGLLCLSRDPAFTELAADTPEAFAFMDRMVFLPLHSSLSRGDIDQIADAVVDYYAQRKPCL